MIFSLEKKLVMFIYMDMYEKIREKKKLFTVTVIQLTIEKLHTYSNKKYV
jgi:hypothetical protein